MDRAEETYINGRAEIIKKLLSLQNINNINQDRKRNATTLLHNKIREQRRSSSKSAEDDGNINHVDNGEVHAEDEAQLEAPNEQLEVEADNIPADVQIEDVEEKENAHMSEVQEDGIVGQNESEEQHQQQQEEEEEEVKQQAHPNNNVFHELAPQEYDKGSYHEERPRYQAQQPQPKTVSLLRETRTLPTTSSFQAAYKPSINVLEPKRSVSASRYDDDDDQLSFAERRMRFSGNLSEPQSTKSATAAPAVAPRTPATPKPQNNNNNNNNCSSNNATNDAASAARQNLRQMNQIKNLKKKCAHLCKTLDLKLEDEITQDAPKEEWVNLYNDLLGEAKKTKAKGLYRDVLDWASLFTQQVSEAYRPAGFRGKGFSKVIRESEDFDDDLEELYEQQDIEWFRNIPAPASIVNKFVKKYCQNHWNVLTQEQDEEPATQEEKKRDFAHPPQAAKVLGTPANMPPRAKAPTSAKSTTSATKTKSKPSNNNNNATTNAMMQQMQQMQQMMYYQNMMMQQMQQQQQQYQAMFGQMPHAPLSTQPIQQQQLPTFHPTQMVPQMAIPQFPTIQQNSPAPAPTTADIKEEKFPNSVLPPPVQTTILTPNPVVMTPAPVATTDSSEKTKVDMDAAMKARAAFFKSKAGSIRR